jgi:GntR family transcriptional regulator / MocR family aminotransferase
MREPLYSLEPLFPNRLSGENLTVQLTRRLREAVESGALPLGTRLLGTRQLARRLGLGRNTVSLAFEQLTAEGYFETRHGAGTFVAAHKRKPPRQAAASRRTKPPRAARAASLREYFSIAKGSGPLRPGMPDLANFPARSWNRSARKAIRVHNDDLGYAPASGLQSLREAIATHVRQFRGIAAQPDQIVVVEGAQAAIHLSALVLARPRARVVVEDPCYALARATFEMHDLQLRPVRVDRDGLMVDALPQDAAFAFVTPTHQFPLGGALPFGRRNALLEWAARRDETYIIEDDYDSEFTFKTRPLPPLQTLDRDERVVYIGSFSKTLAPAVRLGYIIAPPHLASAFTAARACTSLGVSIALQETLSDFISEGHFARHIRHMNAVYERRRAVLIQALSATLGVEFSLGPSQSGLHIALIGARNFDDFGAASTADGQRLVTLSQLCVRRRDCRGFVLGFTNGSDVEIQNAALQVAKRIRAHRGAAAP